MRRIATIITVSTVALLALGGTAFALGADGTAAPAAVPISTAVPLSTTVPISTTAPLSTAAPLPIPTAVAAPVSVGSARAAAIAVERVGGGQVTEVERELEHGRVEWEVEVVRGTVEHDIHVDDTTGAVVRETSGPLHDVDDDDHHGYDD